MEPLFNRTDIGSMIESSNVRGLLGVVIIGQAHHLLPALNFLALAALHFIAPFLGWASIHLSSKFPAVLVF